MKKYRMITAALFWLSMHVAAQDNETVFDEAGMTEYVKSQAENAGYTIIYRTPEDTSRTFLAEHGKAYRVVLIFRERVVEPGRRLVIYQRDSKLHLKTLFMARKDQHLRRFRGHMLVTDLPALPVGETHQSMTIDALPKEGKLFIFIKN